MIPLRVTAEFRISYGNDGAFRSIVRALESAVLAHDTGTLIYAWYISPDGRVAFSHEHYVSTEAFMAHVSNAAPLIGRLTGVGNFSRVTFAGEPSEFVLNIVSNAGDAPGSPKIEFYGELG